LATIPVCANTGCEMSDSNSMTMNESGSDIPRASGPAACIAAMNEVLISAARLGATDDAVAGVGPVGVEELPPPQPVDDISDTTTASNSVLLISGSYPFCLNRMSPPRRVAVPDCTAGRPKPPPRSKAVEVPGASCERVYRPLK
jgi:hypothetical protein